MDNADEAETVKQIWPSGARGSVLLTSRDFSTARNPANQGYQVKPFDDDTGALMLLRLLDYDLEDTENKMYARQIAKMLGGLPLALNQIASFITQRKLPLKDFPDLYARNSAQIHGSQSRLTYYEKTLTTTYELSLSRLSGDAAHLQSLLAFLDPDTVHKKILVDGAMGISDNNFAFLRREME